MAPKTDPDHLRFALSSDRALTRPDTSHVWSPHSAATALSLLAAGASGEALAVLTRLLAATRGTLDGHIAALDAAVTACSDPIFTDGPNDRPLPGPGEPAPLDLVSVNDLYVRADRTVLPGFAAALAERPTAAVHRTDFTADPERTRTKINAAVAETTRGTIPDLLPAGAVTADTESVLLNALWMQLAWALPFDPGHTSDQVFHTPGRDRPVPTMHQSGPFHLAEAAGLRMLTLAGHHGLFLDIILPLDDSAHPPVPTEDAYRALHRALLPQLVDVALPRFRVESGFELLPSLPGLAEAMGGTGGGLRGITGDPLRVDAIIHRAVLSVDEIGAKGAAATAVMMVMGAVPQHTGEFRADRPFTFVLRRGPAVLFLGRVTDPEDPGPARPLHRPR